MSEDDVLRCKGLIDGAETLAEAAQMLRAEAQRLDGLAEAGWELTEWVSDDYGFITREVDEPEPNYEDPNTPLPGGLR